MSAAPHEPVRLDELHPVQPDEMQPARLDELRPVLALFAQALAGRAVVLRAGAGDVAPGAAATTPPAITLPALIAEHRCARDNRAAFRIAAMRQALSWSTDDSIDAVLGAASVLWRRVFAALERLRVDAAIERSYPGARADLARQRALESARQQRSAARHWPSTRALDALRRHAAADAQALQAAAGDADAPAMLRHADALRAPDARPLDSARVATAICALLRARALRRPRAGEPELRVPAVLAAAQAQAADTAASAVATARDDGAAAAPAAAYPRGGAAAGGRLAAAGDAAAAAPRRAARTARVEGLAARHARPLLASDADEAPGTAYPIDEWDYHAQRLLPAWCTLIERRLHGSDTAFIHQVRRRHAELARRVHRQFAAWRPEGLRRVHGASDGDEIELDRVIEAVADRRAGLVDDAAWYVRRDRAQRDVATALLVDTSASTDFVLPDGTMGPPRPAPSSQADAVYLYDLAVGAPPPGAPKRRVIDVAKEALALMCDALHTLGDCFAVYTFSGHGRAQVEFRVVKPFHEAVSPRTAAALAALRPHGATRTGAAVRHATARLLRQPQRRRTLIVVTDGYPEDVDYGPLPRDLRYGLEDTAHALRQAQAAGVQTFCLSIDPAGHDYLRRMCPREQYLVIGDLAALPDELAKVYRALAQPRGAF